MSNTSRIISGILVSVAMAWGTGVRAETADPGWQFEVSPYLFAAGLYGTTGTQLVSADVEIGFADILENLDMGLMAAFEARHRNWGFMFDGLFFEVGGEGSKSWQGPGGIGTATGDLEATAAMQLYQLAVGYRVTDEKTKTDLIVGARYTQLDTDLTLVATTGGLLPGGVRELDSSEGWWDPVVGARVLTPFAEQWSAVLYGDVGGFGVGSDLTYQLHGGVHWQFANQWSAKLGYRYLSQDFEEDRFIWDMAAHGPYLGLGIGF